MTNNEQILNNLIGNGQSTSHTKSPNAVPTGTDDEVLITTARVVSLRYKLYIVWIAILIFILGNSFLSPLYTEIQNKKTQITSLDTQIMNLQAKQRQYQTNRALVDTIAEVDSGIVKCLNDAEWCNELPEDLKDNDNFSIARSYILLWDMEDKKMEVNEKKIIKNLDTFLLKNWWTNKNSTVEDMLKWNSEESKIKDEEKITNEEEWIVKDEEWDNEDWDETVDSLAEQKAKILAQLEQEQQTSKNARKWSTNGTVNKITIWDKQRFNDTLYYVPVELSITFDDKDGLLSFIDNVEKKVPEDKDQRLLYKISKITYDVVNYDEPQDTTINMYLYYYEK